MPALNLILKISRLGAPVGRILWLLLVLGGSSSVLGQDIETEPFKLPDTEQILNSLLDREHRPAALAALFVLDQALDRNAARTEVNLNLNSSAWLMGFGPTGTGSIACSS